MKEPRRKESRKSFKYHGEKTMKDFVEFAEKISRDNLSSYVHAYTIFDQGVVSLSRYVGKDWPGTWASFYGYWKAGKFHKFTQKQILAYQVSCNNAVE